MNAGESKKHRVTYFFSANLSLFGLLLFAGSLGTQHLFQVYVWRNTTTESSFIGRYPDALQSCDRGAFLGTVYFGHFYGTKCLNYGLGVRITNLNTRYLSTNIYHFRFWVITSALICLIVVSVILETILSLCAMAKEHRRSTLGMRTHFVLACILPIEIIGLIGCVLYQLRYHFSTGVLGSEDTSVLWQKERVFLDYTFLMIGLSWLLSLFNLILVSMYHCDLYCRERQRQKRIMRRSSGGKLRAFTKESMKNDYDIDLSF